MVTVSLPASPVAVLLSVAEDAVAFALAVAPQAVMDTANARCHHKACQFLHRVLLDFLLEMFRYNTA